MSLKLHSRYGVNPTIPTCFVCGGEKNEIVLLGALAYRITGKENGENVRMAFDKEPCDKCKAFMAQGVIFISVRDGEAGDNPYRTGGWWVLRDEAVRRMGQPGELVEDILRRRVCFIPDSVCDAIGLVKGSGEPPQ